MARPSYVPWVVATVLVLGVIAMILVKLPPGPPGERPMRPEDPSVSDRKPLDRDASLKMIELRNLGLGNLENHKFEDAAQAFQELLTVLPQEPFAARNLAISLVKLAAEKIDERADPQGFEDAAASSLQAVKQLEQIESESALPHFLHAVLATKSGDPSEVAQHLKAATDRDPDNAAWKFQWFELARSLRDPDEKQAALAAGNSAAALASENLFVQKEVLAENLSNLVDLAKKSPDDAAARTDAIAAQLEKLREPLRVLGVSIQVQSRVDIVAVLDTVLAAVREKEWQKARNEFFKIKNLLSQETATDADLIHPHPLTYHDPLNYVAVDLSPEFYQRADLPDDTLPEIEVTWKDAEGVLPDIAAEIFQLEPVDIDLDDVDDLVGLTRAGLTCYRRASEPAGWETMPLDLPVDYSRFVTADLDDDVSDVKAVKPGEPVSKNSDLSHGADSDFVLYGKNGLLVVENVLVPETNARILKEVAAEKTGLQDVKDVSEVKLVDFDHDGDLDLVTVAAGKLGLWTNLGNFQFQDVADRSLLPPAEFQVLSVAAVDWDRDNDVDLLISGKDGCGWMENLRHGRLRFHDSDSDWADANQLTVAELDGDGNWDVVVSELEKLKVLFSHSPLAGSTTVEREQVVLESPFQRVQLADFDNDSGIDLLVTRGAEASIFRNLGTGAFEEQPNFTAAIPAGSTEFFFGDVDADGDLDVIASGRKTVLLANEGGNKNHFLTVKFRGWQVKANEQGASKRVNHYGVGNTVEVKVGHRYQAQIAAGQSTRFGIGPAEKADIVRVLATNGVPQNRIEPKANELICERQVLLTSCPYLYTWNGSRYEFVTDLLWAAPLGLKASQSELVPWRDWEYLKIDGAKLQPQEGEYRLQITEELWEAAYFDQVKLFAIDHPADSQIFTNEKVGSPALAAHQIHTVREPRLPKSARDQAGRDWSSQLAHRDENFTRTYTRKIAQGLCEDHYLELDLGSLADPKQVTLFLAGWVRPTDTNINVSLDQHPDLPLPSGLALWTPAADGQWREISPHVGFPNGKTKTIALDLSGVFAAGDYRLRLISNREFYWDQAFFTVDESPVEFHEIELPLLRADLHARGVSRGVLPTGDGPETYEYDQVASIPAWPDMAGMFTRFGDVRPLLAVRDDQLAVLGVGDEMSLAFQVPADELPEGWSRDFVLYNVGWVKDCLLNTWEGQRVEPLPFAGLNGHDYWTGRPEATGAYADYLKTYQTRRQATPFRHFVRRWTPEAKRTLPDWERDRRNGD